MFEVMKKVWEYGENLSALCECYCTARRKSDYKLHHISSSNPYFRNSGLCLYPRLLLNEEHQIMRSDTLPRWKVLLQQFEREVNQTPCVSRVGEYAERKLLKLLSSLNCCCVGDTSAKSTATALVTLAVFRRQVNQIQFRFLAKSDF